ncbi:MAG: MOSC domain-containing protein [Planctomycetota bacterium]|nr:MOSC domain-containing protein [Planctomycetota bacterium]MDA1114708.1 MOSC domain-containing protein [Planctomycetota bacterium]
MPATLLALLAALPAEIETPGGPLRTGMRKQPLLQPTQLGLRALEGDGCEDLVHHGLEDQAVCVMPVKHYAWWRTELNLDPEAFPLGSFGENFAVDGQDETTVLVGNIYRIGHAEVEVTKPRVPCSTLNKVWGRNDMAALMGRAGLTGWYLRVLKPGLVTAGQKLELLHEEPAGISVLDTWKTKYRSGKK